MNSNRSHFERAYTTGTDVWSHTPYQRDVMRMLTDFPANGILLDVGAGRGLLDFFLVERGYRVIGMDYVASIVDSANEEVKRKQAAESIRFVEGNVLDIPFVGGGFAGVLDVGLLQHLPQEHWAQYLGEVYRVLSPEGMFLNISLSRKTTKFLSHQPMKAETGMFEKYGLQYYFFTEEEIVQLLGEKFEVADQFVEHYESRSDPGETLALVFTKCKKI
jgi:ubiquinone/menaquinone biosynthesis C-methylase UbiE